MTPTLASPAERELPPIEVEVVAARLRAHAAGTPVACLAGALAAGLLVWALAEQASLLHLWWWLPAVGAAVALRLGIWSVHRQRLSTVDENGQTRWLTAYRVAIVLHGLVWGAAAGLPTTLADPALQLLLLLVVGGLAIGALAQASRDLSAGLSFALPAVLPLALALLMQHGALPAVTVVGMIMVALLMLLLVRAAQRAQRATRDLIAIRQAEQQSLRSARLSEHRLRQIFDYAGQGICIYDQDLRVSAWNELMLVHNGVKAGDVHVGMRLREALVKLGGCGLFGEVEIEAEADRRLAAIVDGGPSIVHHHHADGRLVQARRVPLPEGGLVIFYTDITEQQAALAKLADEQRMRALVQEATEQGFWTIDNDLLTSDANPAMCRMLGLTQEQMLGRSIYDFVDEANAEIFRQHVRLRAHGRAEGYEITLRRADGSQVHCFNNATPIVDAQGHKRGALGLFSDISQHKQTELLLRQTGEQLAQKSRLLEHTLDSLDQGVLSVDAGGRCTAWNQRFLELMQLPLSLMQSQPKMAAVVRYQVEHDHFGPGRTLLDPPVREVLGRVLEGAADHPPLRYLRRRTDGRLLEVVSHIAADAAMVRTYTDVTDAHAAEAALIAARDEAERANRAKSDFLSRMSHELRTPMNAVLGFGQLLAADTVEPLSPSQAERVRALLRGGQHLLTLIDDILDISRIEAGTLQLNLQPVDLLTLVRDTVNLMQPTARQAAMGLTLHAQVDAGDSVALADTTRLRQVLLNLLSNALKFNRPGGEVQVSCGARDGIVWCEVSDQGRGIAKDQQPKLFQAFERLNMNGAVEGSGIGLALSRSLMTLMRGEIGVRSAPGEGSVFWLHLPCAKLAAASAEAAGEPAANQPALTSGGQHDVLYIEDNEVNQVLMAGMLAHRPQISLRMASDGASGVAMAAERVPQLVLLDIQLPDFDGFEVLRRLRLLPGMATVPVLAVSANALPTDLQDAHIAGFAGYLTKPLDFAGLLAMVDLQLATAKHPRPLRPAARPAARRSAQRPRPG